MALRDDILASFDQLLARCSDDDPGLLEELRRRIEEVRKQLKFAPASTYRQVFQDHLAAAQAAPAV